ncbi:MAG: 3-phosphoshikimate 1-carboxyvinyltransferase [Verrucomicrobiota bacterium]
MSLPDLIEIVPLDKPVQAEMTVPGSKSITNRALILAALAEGEVTLEGALWSEDTQIMADCLQELGFMVDVKADPDEVCNRTITVYGKGGVVPSEPLELAVGNAGTAARFLAAFVCLGKGVYRLDGVPRMRERPQAGLFNALRELGYRVDSPNDKLPALIHGGGPRPGAACRVSIGESSQFASALILCGQHNQWTVEVTGDNAEESPYVAMTVEMARSFPPTGIFHVDPDASSASYIWGADWLLSRPGSSTSGSRIAPAVEKWFHEAWQMDAQFARYAGEFPVRLSRVRDLGDSIMTAIVLAPFVSHAATFEDLTRLRVQECERVAALRTELTRCGARVVEEGDTLTVYPSTLHGAEVETYNDHRMAMCFAILGLKVPGIRIKNPACVKKTFPNFFQKLAAAPSRGLGAAILDAKTGRKLGADELFAD